MHARAVCWAPAASPARSNTSFRPAQRAARPLPPARGLSTNVNLGGEPHDVIHSAAASDDVLSFFVQEHLAGGSHRTKSKKLKEVMQVNLVTAAPGEELDEVVRRLKDIEGCPVVEADGQLAGVLSKKDLAKGGKLVKDVMTATPITLTPGDKVSKAAHTMIDNKIHRVPIVEDGKLVGLVTRTDIFWALASDNDRTDWFHAHGIDI